MLRPARLLLVGVGLLSSACAGSVGWFRADTTGAHDEAIALDPSAPCPPAGDAAEPVLVLVPGLGGDSDELRAASSALAKAKPAALYLMRYSPMERRDALAERMATGLDRLQQCRPGATGPLLVLAHSAGGLVASLAAARVSPPAEWLVVITVASPLAGLDRVPAFGRPGRRPMVREVGTAIASYPEAAKGVRLVHLRTSATADENMQPRGDHLPNDKSVGVPGAVQRDLPAELGHSQALEFAAKKVADGSWREWLE